MAVALEDLRARLDSGLEPAPSLGSLKARVGMGRTAPIPRRKPPRASEHLIEAMIQVESGGDPNAVSPKGAQGLMQIMPATAKALGLADPFDPEQNRQAGTLYINSMLNRFEGDPELALMAYNWGPGNVDKWLSKGRPSEAVPEETRDYVEKLLPVAQGAGKQPTPTLEDLKARVDRAVTSQAPTLESLRARVGPAQSQESRLIRSRGGRPRPAAQDPDEGQSLTRSALHGIAQGAAGGLAGFPEAVGIERQKAARGLLDQYDKIDQDGTPGPNYRALTGGLVTFYLTADPETRASLRAEAEAAIRPVAEEPAYQVGRRIRESTAGAFPIPPEHEGRFPVQLGRGVGSTATFLATGIAGRLLKLPVLAVTAGTGAVANSAETFRDAIDRGASFDDAYQASRLSGLVGTSEALPIVRLLGRYDKASGGQLKRLLVNAGKGALEEGGQETLQNIAENVIASDLVAYDPERGTFQGTGEAAGVGGSVGALFNVLASMLGVRVRAGRPQETAPESTGEQAAPGVVPEPGAQDAPVRPPESPDEGIPPEAPPPPAQGPAVFTSETQVQPGLPPATGEPKRVKIPATAGTATPEVQQITDPDGTVRVEQVRLPSKDDGTLGRLKFKSISKSIESYLDAAAASRNRPTLDREQKALAEEARKSNLAAFAAAEVELARRVEEGNPARIEELIVAGLDRSMPKTTPGAQQATYGASFRAGVAGETRSATYQDPIKQRAYVQGHEDGQAFRASPEYRAALSAEGVVIETLTVRGKRTSFTFAATEQGLETLRETAGRYGKLPVQTSYSRAPAVAGLEVPEGSPAGVERAIETERGTARVVFPDELHERLYDLAEGRPDKAEARALYSELQGFVIENFRGPADVIALARDYRAEVMDQARTAAQYRGGRPEAAGLVIDPEMQTEYLQRPTLASLRARVDRAMGRQPADELPETAYAGPGEAYVGMVRDQVEGIAPAVPDKPIRREDILRPLLKDLGVPIYQGRIKSKRFLGFYRRHIEEIRIKRMSDIEVASHELAHMLDDRFPEIRRQWLPASNANKEIRDELRGVSYDKSKLFEGFAEFVRLWSTQREEAKARAPKFYGWFEDFLTRNEHGPALRKAQGGMHAWFAQDAVSRARSKIGVTKEINAGLTRPFDKFRQGVADDLHGIYQMERRLTGTINPVGAYETARLTRGKHAIIEGTLLYGAPVVKPDGSHAFEGKGLSQILDPVAERLDDFLMYAVGRSAQELRSQGRENLFTGAEIKGMVALETPEFRTAFNEYQVWNRAVLDFAEAKGVINPFFRETWKRTQYLPFHRVGQPGAFSPVPGDWKGIRALTGGTDNLRDILGNMIGNASTLIDAALTNEARLEVANLARQRGGGRFLVKIPTDERITKVHREEIRRAILEALGVEQKTQLPVEQQILVDRIVSGMSPMVSLLQRGQSPYGNNVVAVLRKGKPEFYEVADPLLYRSLTHLNRPSKGALLRLLSAFRRVSQLTITLVPDFLIANIARDTLSGFIMSRHGFKPFKDSVIGLVSRLKSDPNYRDFIANGGGFSSYFTEEAAFKKHLKRFYASKGINFKTVLDTPSKFFYAVERIADAFEMATRLGEYRKAIRKGEHPRHAAYSGREVSTDFAMRGDWAPIGIAYDSIIFTKAAVNGLDRSYRGVAHDQNRVAIAGRIAALAMVSMGLSAMWRGIPDYDDMEDWDRDGHWHFFIPKPETIQAWADGRPLPPIEDRYEHFRYPKIWEIGAISSIAERTLTRLLDDEAGELPEDFARILLDTFRVEYMPQIVAPIFEAGVPFTEFKGINRRRFFDRPIQDARLQQLQPWARSSPYTSTTLRKLGEATRNLPRGGQVIPVQVEALLRGYFNTFALYGLQLSDAMFFDDTPDIPIDRYPVIRRFYQRSPLRRTKYLNEFYEMVKLATEARRTMREMDRSFRPEYAKETAESPENLEYDQLTGANEEMRGIVSEIRSVMRAPTLAALHALAKEMGRRASYRPTINKLRRTKDWRDLGALKAELLDMTILERNKHAKTVVQDIEAQRREGLGVITIRPGTEAQRRGAVR